MTDGAVEGTVQKLFQSVLSDANNTRELEYLKQSMGLTDMQIIASWVLWDTGIRKYENDVYSSEALRCAMHMHNLLRGSWHEKRQEQVWGYLQTLQPASICEIGFGTPQKYVKELLQSGRTDILLCDYEETSVRFAQTLLSYWSPHWSSTVRVQIFDMNRDLLPSGYDVYLFQDSIEHAQDPTATLRHYADAAAKDAHFIFSLPIEIENPIPEHSIYWKDPEEVLRWIEKSGLAVLDSNEIHVDPDLDIYASSLHPDFREIVLLAKKS